MGWPVDFFNTIMQDGKRLLKRYHEKRSLDQNSYLHAMFESIAKDSETTKWYVKCRMKELFLSVHTFAKPYTRDTSGLNKKEFWEFVDNVLNFVSEFWYTYPTPDERKNGVR